MDLQPLRQFYAAAASLPWAVVEERIDDVVAAIELHASPAGELAVSGSRSQTTDLVSRVGAAAVIPIHGTITHRLDAPGWGFVSTRAIAAALRGAVEDASIRTIVLDVDSPGGTVPGVAELSDELHAARASKRLVAVADSLMGSAAYWIGAQAHEIVATPSSRLGSIGVFAIHANVKRALENAGVEVTVIKAGRHKAEGSPFGPLSDEDRAAVQARIGESYEAFIAHVARGRGVSPAAVRGGFGEGRIVGAAAAVQMGLADRVATVDEVLAAASAVPPKQGKTMRASDDRDAECAAIRGAAEDIRALARRV